MVTPLDRKKVTVFVSAWAVGIPLRLVRGSRCMYDQMHDTIRYRAPEDKRSGKAPV